MYKRGFSLIELTVASIILLAVLGAVYAAFRTGIFGYQDIEENLRLHQSARIILSQINLDLRNAFVYANQDTRFFGKRNEVSFLTVARTYGDDVPSLAVAFVSYALAGNRVLRVCRMNKDSLNEKAIQQPQEMSVDVEDLSFLYGYMNAADKPLEWKEAWNDESTLPCAVKIKLSMKHRVKLTFERTVFLPAA